ncbi:hypothetical protein HID58_045293 [Brassica napus]|uniref:Uncharacterized protein n=2 Tax=Brassica TaxID=3705 RepID=A0A8X7R1V7_BRACI|nr:protein BIG GRAIN 1-like D [Brassica napus]KAG2279658.1 hypothetical protein Bca52824_050878 [Brassica carinata]KAH0895725.1 hypothetical protein HID58_045293 [Brassica napus]CAF1883547.1 unnamed protein product [Brassica napus]
MHRSKTQSRNPSFSSTLLDEIYNSIDPKTQPFLNSLNTAKKQSISVNKGRDRLFGSISSSSDSNSNSSIFSSSDTELTHPKKTTSSRPLCFGPSKKTKPRKTEDKALFHQNRAKTEDKALFRQNRATRVSDDCDYASDAPKITRYNADWENARTRRSTSKLKTPASPGVRIVNFINSLFSNNGSSKQSSSAVKSYPRKTSYDVTKPTDYYHPSATCSSSASSFSRSCLNKTSEKPSERIKRSVRFSPVNVIVAAEEEEEEDYLSNGYIRKSVKKNVEDGGRRSVEEIAREFLRDYHKNHENGLVKSNDFEDYEDVDDDVASDSSSDLFELDLAGSHHHNLYGDELPVYETTFAGLIL